MFAEHALALRALCVAVLEAVGGSSLLELEGMLKGCGTLVRDAGRLYDSCRNNMRNHFQELTYSSITPMLKLARNGGHPYQSAADELSIGHRRCCSASRRCCLLVGATCAREWFALAALLVRQSQPAPPQPPGHTPCRPVDRARSLRRGDGQSAATRDGPQTQRPQSAWATCERGSVRRAPNNSKGLRLPHLSRP